MLKRSLLSGSAFLLLASVLPPALPAGPAEPSVSGRWKFVIQVEEQKKDYDLELKQDGNKVSGTLISSRSGRKDAFDGGSFAEGKLKFEVKRQNEEVYAVEAEQKGPAKFEGKILINGRGPLGLLMSRVSSGAVVGKWNVVSKSPDGQEYPSTLDVTEDGGALKAKATSRLGAIDLTSVAFDGEKLSFEITLPIEGNSVAFTVNAEFKDGNKLVGRWKTRDADFTGEWTASREAPAAPAVAAKPAAAAVPPPTSTPAAPPAHPAAGGLSGKWYAVSTTPNDGQRSIQLEIAADGNKLTGKLHFRRGSIDIQNGKAEGNKIEFTFPFPTGGDDVQVKVEAEVVHEVLKGKWTAASGESGEITGRKPLVL